MAGMKDQSKPGMIQIGRYNIRLMDGESTGDVWIDRSGEGGQFKIEVFEEYIDKLMAEHF